jgi:hypothetical protein
MKMTEPWKGEMRMKEYKYNKLTHAGLSGKTGAVAIFLTIAALVFLGIATGRADAIKFALAASFVYSIFIYGFSWWPNITCDNEALFVEFLGWPIKIPWTDIIGIKEVHYMPKKAWLVTARKITILHYLFGLQFALKLVPGFLIWENISSRDDLLSKIRRNMRAAN